MDDESTFDMNAVQQLVNEMTSIISDPNGCSLWGDRAYPGNCDGRLFLWLVIRYGARRVADPMNGSGTTRDVVEWLNGHLGAEIEYWGEDLHTGFNLHAHDLPGEYDLVWIHPPYWNIHRYSDDPADLSTCEEYAEFLKRLRVCLKRCFSAVAPGGRLAILVGDVRKRGQYTPVVQDVLNMESELGALQSMITKQQQNCRSDRTTHSRTPDVQVLRECCVIFRHPA